jgi:hypothetical protein
MTDPRDEANRAEAEANAATVRQWAPDRDYLVDEATGAVDRTRTATLKVRHRNPARMAALDAAGNGFIIHNATDYSPELYEVVSDDAEGDAPQA